MKIKDEFDNFEKQGRYILRLIKNSTDLDRKCQLCGKPGKLKNNRISPYDVQFICSSCRRGLEKDLVSNTYKNIPLINVKSHITNPTLIGNMVELNEETISKIKTILKGGYNKQEALSYLNLTPTTYNKLLSKYELIDKDIRQKLNHIYKEENAKRIRETKFKYTRNDEFNNLSKLKEQKSITNRMINERTDNRVTLSTISHIANGKVEPQNSTMALLAYALDTDIYHIFPKCTEFKGITDEEALKEYMIGILSKITFLYCASKYTKFNKFLINLSKDTGIGIGALKSFILSTKYSVYEISVNTLKHSHIKEINKLYKKLGQIKFSISKIEEVEEWKKQRN